MDMNRISGVQFQHQTTLAGQAQSAPKQVEVPQEKSAEMPKDQVDIRGKQAEEKPAQQQVQQPPQQQVQQPGQEPQQQGAIKPHKKWLFINYVAGDCNLTEFQLKNLDQQEKVGSDANTHIVAYVDVGPNPAPLKFGTKEGETQGPGEPGSWSGCRTLYISKDDETDKLNSEVIEEHGNHVDMSSGQTLKKFLKDALTKFPADHVAFIFNDHGGGFTGAMSDETDGGFMSLPDTKKAFDEVQAETGKKLDIIGYDACLMAGTEVAYELKNNAEIFLAAEESEGGPGWTYDSMLGGRTLGEAIQKAQSSLFKIDVGPREFAKIIVDVNAEHNNDIPTFSATDLTKMDKLKDSSEGLAQAIIKTDDKQAIKDAIGKTENYGGGWSPYKDMRDLHHLSRNIIAGTSDENVKKAAEAVIKSVEEVVFANEVNPQQHPESKGLHIYAPTTGSMGQDYAELQFAKDTHWDEAIESLGVKFDPTKKGPKVWPDGSPRKQNKS